MTYTLNITFCGLCMFVRDGQNVNVLLPRATGLEANGPKEAHHAVLLVADPTSNSLGNPSFIPRTRIDLKAHAKGVTLNMGNGIEKLNDYWADSPRVLREFLDQDLHDGLIARVVLDGGRAYPLLPQGIWNVAGYPGGDRLRSFAPRVLWSMQMDGTSLDLSSVFSSGAINVQPPLKVVKVNANNAVNIEIRNVEFTETQPNPPDPGSPGKGAPSDHFPAYFRFFGKTGNVPELQFDDVQQIAALESIAVVPPIPGITPFTCMTGGGE